MFIRGKGHVQDSQLQHSKPASHYALSNGQSYLPKEGHFTDEPFGPHLEAINGRYEGKCSESEEGTYLLDLFINVNSNVLNACISGDIYRMCHMNWPGQLFNWQILEGSWQLENITIDQNGSEIWISGDVIFEQANQRCGTLNMRMPIGVLKPVSPISVNLSLAGGNRFEFSCLRKSKSFHKVSLNIDVCDSVNVEPILPAIAPDLRNIQRSKSNPIGFVSSLDNLGIDVDLDVNRSTLDDGDPRFSGWSSAELHDLFKGIFLQDRTDDSDWQMECLLAGSYLKNADAQTAGVVFDSKLFGTGSQGFAIFRDHAWFDDLVAKPKRAAEFAAHHKLNSLYMNGVGLAFGNNPIFSKNRDMVQALAASFDLGFGADGEELSCVQNRYRFQWKGDLSQEYANGVMGQPPIELLLRSAGYFDFMQPVRVEFRLRNKTDLPIELDTNLNPEHGRLSICIQRPDGRVTHYAPALMQFATPKMKTLRPLLADGTNEGEDRHSENVYLSFGADEFYFDEPGEYRIKAIYHGNGELLIPSNVCRIRIGRPFTRDEDRFAQDYFSHDTGLSVYFGGSDSPYLASGMACLQEAVDRFPKSRLGAQTALTLAQNLQKPFFRMNEKEYKLDLYRGAKPGDVLHLTDQILNSQKQDDATLTNLEYHQTRRLRAEAMVATGDVKEAMNELKNLVRYLKKRGVNRPVLDEIRQYAARL